MRRVLRELRIERDLRDPSSHDGGVGQRAVRACVHVSGIGSVPLRGDMAVDRARVAIRRERRHVEFLADTLQIEARNGRVRRVADIVAVQSERRGAAGGDFGARDRRRQEPQVAFHVGAAGAAVGPARAGPGWNRTRHVIVRIHVGLGGRNLQRARHLAQINMPRLPLQVERNGFGFLTTARAGQGHTASRRRARPVRSRARIDTDMPPLELRISIDRARRITGRSALGRMDGHRSTQTVDIGQLFAVDVHARVCGDIAFLFRIVQERRKIQVAYRQIAADRLARRFDVGDDPPCERTCRRLHVQVHAEAIERSVQLDQDLRLHLDSGERRHQPRNFRQRHLVGADLQVQIRRAQIILHRAVNRQRALRRPYRQPFHVQRIVVHRNAAGQRVQRDRGLGTAERRVRDLNRVPDRFVLERQPGIQMLESFRDFDPGCTDRTIDHE